MSLVDRVRVQALVAAMEAPDALARRMVRVPEEIEGQPVDLRTRLFLTFLKLDHQDPHALSVGAQRALIDLAERTFAPTPEPAERGYLEVPLAGRTLRLRSTVPPGAGRRGFLYLHGGGFCTGNAEAYDAFCARLARRVGCRVWALDYRLAPEHPFPAAVDDVVDTWRWLRANADTLGVDAASLGVGGDSAGGNLSAVLCNTLGADELPAVQVLLYPGTDMVHERPSRHTFGQGYYMSNAHVRWFYETYVPDAAQRLDPRASPIYAAHLGEVPAVLALAGLDTLVDEGRAYGARLEAAGVPVETVFVPGMVHGFVNLFRILPAAAGAVDAVCAAVERSGR